jgi:hypothetical protein
MKKFCILPLIAALAVSVSCQKQQSEEERKAEVERQVQERVAAERQADEKQRLAQQQADLDAREKALAAKESVAVVANAPAETIAPQAVDEAPAEVEETETDDTAETRSTASYGTFYRKLEPYGAWRETNDYGYVWQPREAEESRDWRPYVEGRWVYTDAGWTWVSEEPFGWATYHYGRWVRLRRVGWVWVPGQQWAPAWVSWRTSKDYVGWAPLPPEARFNRKTGIHNWADNYYDIGPDQYSFVPENEFGSRRIRQSVVPVERNITIVIDTTNVTNITFANTTVVNHGPNFEEMRSRSRQPIERYRLERQVSSDTTALPTVRGEVLVMSAPPITRVHGVDRPQMLKETVAQTTVEKSWAPETDRAAADRARAKMKAEVAPPSDAPPKTFVKPLPPGTGITMVTPAPGSTVAATPALAPPPRATPKPVATMAPPVRATPVTITTPAPPILPSPKPAATAREIAPPITTPSVLASPSARPRPPTVFTKPSPASTTAPVEPIATPAVTPARAPQTPPRRIIPSLMNTPAAPPSPNQPPQAATKPSPRNDLAPRPVVRPPVPKPTPAVPPSAIAPATDVPPPLPNETKPVIRQTPPGVRTKPPVVTPANPPTTNIPPSEKKGPVVQQTPADVRMKPPAVAPPPPSNVVPPPVPEEAKTNMRPKRPETVPGEKPTPTPPPPPKL